MQKPDNKPQTHRISGVCEWANEVDSGCLVSTIPLLKGLDECGFAIGKLAGLGHAPETRYVVGRSRLRSSGLSASKSTLGPADIDRSADFDRGTNRLDFF